MLEFGLGAVCASSLAEAKCFGRLEELVQDDVTLKIHFAKELNKLRQQWDRGEITMFTVLHISPETDFSSNVFSSKLKAHYEFRLTLREADISKLAKEALEVVTALSAKLSGRVSDLRWGFIFSTSKESWELFFDRTGTRGVVNGACVDFLSGSLKAWAESKLSDVFR
jgi:hypothetical protein